MKFTSLGSWKTSWEISLSIFLSTVCFLLLVFCIFPSTTLIVKKETWFKCGQINFYTTEFFGEFICGILIMYLFNYFSQLIKLLIKFNRDHAVYLTFKLISFKNLGPPPKKSACTFWLKQRNHDASGLKKNWWTC